MNEIFLLLLLAVVVSTTHAASVKLLQEWTAFKAKYQKIYKTPEEEDYRMKIFEKSRQFVLQHNQKYRHGETSFTMKLNKFSDLLLSEYNRIYNGYKQSENHSNVEMKMFIPPNYYKPPLKVDWLRRGAVTPVKNQGNCGACYAFATTAAVEGHFFIKNKKMLPLSAQNIIDCSSSYGNEGCQGGHLDFAYQYMKDNGVDLEVCYPYTGFDSGCYFNKTCAQPKITGYTKVPKGNEKLLQKAVFLGPVAVAVDASQDSFRFYHKGIYKEPACSGDNLNHGMTIVGYGTDSLTDHFWMLKNSWGVDWGDQGYMKLARNAKNMCGIANDSQYPLVAKIVKQEQS